MPVNTRTSNANSRPGLVDLPIQKCSRQQVDKDNTCTRSVAKITRKVTEKTHQEAIKSIAMMEDAIEREEQAIQRYTDRPDLRPDPRMPSEPTESQSGSEKGLVLMNSALTG